MISPKLISTIKIYTISANNPQKGFRFYVWDSLFAVSESDAFALLVSDVALPALAGSHAVFSAEWLKNNLVCSKMFIFSLPALGFHKSAHKRYGTYPRLRWPSCMVWVCRSLKFEYNLKFSLQQKIGKLVK